MKLEKGPCYEGVPPVCCQYHHNTEVAFPDLLAACKLALRFKHPSTRADANVFEKIEQAIAKAEEGLHD